MAPIKLKFVDYWRDFNIADNYLLALIDRSIINYELSESPDIIISLGFGKDYKNYQCKKIQHITNEAHLNPNFAEFDYLIGAQNEIKYVDRSCYIPFWISRYYQAIKTNSIDDIHSRLLNLSDQQLLNRKFCSFIGTTNRRQHRGAFIEQLQQYKNVDVVYGSTSKLNALPNDNGFESKLSFLGQYKFNIAFENHDKCGYITEKPFDALYAITIPIYFGNIATIKYDFNFLIDDLLLDNSKFILANMKYSSIIDYIKYLDSHDDEYLKQLHKIKTYNFELTKYRSKFSQFLKSVADQH